MNKFNLISKKIGLLDSDVIPSAKWPEKEKALELYRKVSEEECEQSFEEVFKIYLFAKAPTNPAEKEVCHIIAEAYREGKRIFSSELVNN